MELAHLGRSVALRELASLARAGDRLHLSPSAVFCQIRQLEDELGQKLYERISERRCASPRRASMWRSTPAASSTCMTPRSQALEKEAPAEQVVVT